MNFVALLAVGCAAGPAFEGRARPAGPGVEVVEVEATSFGFRPNHILAKAGSEVRLRVRNASVIGHNLTLLLPDGKVAKSADVGSGETAELSFRIPASGRYPIYCDKLFHRQLGMEGVIGAR